MPTVLCADDFALSRGVSDGILELIADGRLSATSALVTTEDWARSAGRLADLHARAAVGLHLNLTLGSPLGPMPGLAPRGTFPDVVALMRLAFAGRLAPAELDAEIGRQFDHFEGCFGRPPDFVDGHEHAHVLPGVRGSLLRAVRARSNRARLLVRDPSDSVASIARRGVSVGKALLIRALATGFGAAVVATGALKNDSFAGFTSFGDRSGFPELDRFLLHARGWHLVMCHPGHPDPGDRGAPVPHAARRREEYVGLRRKSGLPDLIWHPDRAEAEAAARSVFSDGRSAAPSPAPARP